MKQYLKNLKPMSYITMLLIIGVLILPLILLFIYQSVSGEYNQKKDWVRDLVIEREQIRQIDDERQYLAINQDVIRNQWSNLTVELQDTIYILEEFNYGEDKQVNEIVVLLHQMEAYVLEFIQEGKRLDNSQEVSERIGIFTEQIISQMDSFISNYNQELNKQQEQLSTIYYGTLVSYVILVSILLMKARKKFWKPYVDIRHGMEKLGLQESSVTDWDTRASLGDISISEKINSMFDQINEFMSLNENMNNNASFMEILDFINVTFSAYIPYNYIGVSLLDDDELELKASYGVSDGSIVGLPEKIVGYSWPLKDTSLQHLIENGTPRIINDLEAHCGEGNIQTYNRIILDAGVRSSITLPLIVSGSPVGVIFFSSKYKNVYHEGHIKFLKTIVNSIAISLNQRILINDILYSSALALAKLAEARDEDTGEHLNRMKVYSRMITEMLREDGKFPETIDVEYIELIERYSPLHDIGKVGIRDDILLKPGKLTADEFDQMKQHAAFGGKVLRSAEKKMQKRGNDMFRIGIEIAESHHEKWDGSGYPMGLKGNEIPISARIVAVADVFDALTSKRPYKEEFSLDKTFEIMEEGKGTHFDPIILELFINNKEKIIHKYKELRGIECEK